MSYVSEILREHYRTVYLTRGEAAASGPAAMGKRGARGNSKQMGPAALNAASSPDAPWLSQLDASGSEGSEPYSESETELSGSDLEDGSDRAGAAPLSRKLGNGRNGGVGGDSDGVSSHDELGAAVVDVLQHSDPVVMTPQTDAATAEDAPCALLFMSNLHCTACVLSLMLAVRFSASTGHPKLATACRDDGPVPLSAPASDSSEDERENRNTGTVRAHPCLIWSSDHAVARVPAD